MQGGKQGGWVSLYYLAVVIMGNYLLLNVFLAIAVDGLSDDDDDDDDSDENEQDNGSAAKDGGENDSQIEAGAHGRGDREGVRLVAQDGAAGSCGSADAGRRVWAARTPSTQGLARTSWSCR